MHKFHALSNLKNIKYIIKPQLTSEDINTEVEELRVKVMLATRELEF